MIYRSPQLVAEGWQETVGRNGRKLPLSINLLGASWKAKLSETLFSCLLPVAELRGKFSVPVKCLQLEIPIRVVADAVSPDHLLDRTIGISHAGVPAKFEVRAEDDAIWCFRVRNVLSINIGVEQRAYCH